MRKAFWICTIAVIAAACGVLATAKVGPRTPQGIAVLMGLKAVQHHTTNKGKDSHTPAPIAHHTSHSDSMTMKCAVEESTVPEVVAVARTEMPSHIIIERAPESCGNYSGCQDHGNAPTSAIMTSCARCVEECESYATPVMPYCSDEAACDKAMPHAVDAVVCPKDSNLFCFWLGWCESDSEKKSEPTEVKKEEMPADVVPMSGSEDQEEKAMEEAQPQQDPHHYHHQHESDYIVCPYSGKCYPREAPVTPSEKPVDVKVDDEKPSDVKTENEKPNDGETQEMPVDGCKTDCSCEKKCSGACAADEAKCTCKDKSKGCGENCKCDGKCKCCKDSTKASCDCSKKSKTVKVKDKTKPYGCGSDVSEPCECPKEKKQIKGLGDCEEQEVTPMHPQLDTMEFRPSDAIPYSVFPGPF